WRGRGALHRHVPEHSRGTLGRPRVPSAPRTTTPGLLLDWESVVDTRSTAATAPRVGVSGFRYRSVLLVPRVPPPQQDGGANSSLRWSCCPTARHAVALGGAT